MSRLRAVGTGCLAPQGKSGPAGLRDGGPSSMPAGQSPGRRGRYRPRASAVADRRAIGWPGLAGRGARDREDVHDPGPPSVRRPACPLCTNAAGAAAAIAHPPSGGDGAAEARFRRGRDRLHFPMHRTVARTARDPQTDGSSGTPPDRAAGRRSAAGAARARSKRGTGRCGALRPHQPACQTPECPCACPSRQRDTDQKRKVFLMVIIWHAN